MLTRLASVLFLLLVLARLLAGIADWLPLRTYAALPAWLLR